MHGMEVKRMDGNVNTVREVLMAITDSGFEYRKDFGKDVFNSIYSDVVYDAERNNGEKLTQYMIRMIASRYLPVPKESGAKDTI
jgi:hypothetical protein